MRAKRDTIKTQTSNTSKAVVVATKTKTTSKSPPCFHHNQQLRTLQYAILVLDLITLEFHSEHIINSSN